MHAFQLGHGQARKRAADNARRFPESESPSAFWANLAVGVDMVTENGRRWPVGLHGTPARFGKLLEYVNFDATFFAVHGKQASVRGHTPPGTAQQRWRCCPVYMQTDC